MQISKTSFMSSLSSFFLVVGLPYETSLLPFFFRSEACIGAFNSKKKRSSRVTELELQIIQLQEELKKTRDQLKSTESWKRRAQQEAEDAKKQFLLMLMKLEDSKTQMVELSTAEDARIQELRKISQERDRAWQSELEAIQNQHSVDSAALASAMSEIRRLKLQLEMVLRSEAALAKKSEADHLEIHSSQKDLAEASFAIENLKLQLAGSEKAEADAKFMLFETRKQLEIAQSTIESLLTDGSKLMESFSIVATELKESRSRVKSLEETVKKLQEEQYTAHIQALIDLSIPKRLCFGSSDNEVEQLMSVFEDSWIVHQQEQIENTVKTQCTYEMMERMSTDYKLRVSELELRLSHTTSEVSVLKADLFDREEELRRIADSNMNLLEYQVGIKLTQSIADVAELKSKLTDKETVVERLSEENEQLKSELTKVESENHKVCEAAMLEMDLAKTAEKEALVKLGLASEEAEKNNQRAMKVVEELKTTRAEKSEMEAELRKLKVQAEQWKKAAETAIVMLTDSEYKSAAGKLMSLPLPFTDELDDECSRKKKSFVFRRIRNMWNKDQK
ncbi:interactor of constitutive active ROPs 3-like isoform X1 [Canna indica]|uniref:Interactor of constitutive active ROPs 3-like isoform X1 n=1 Tax=Canna indica TaxID=4628 RepID=A0AAQ3JUC3_9LILI|nr:interactor of constitutive active ROPs 3-like isoform X1 [Canna indica]